MADERKRPRSRTSRFRRSSRFRKPKAPPSLDGKGKEKAKEAAAPAKPGAPGPPAAGAPPTPAAPPASEIVNVLSINVKEWFQTAAFDGIIKFSHWGKYERRVERGIHIILSLLRQHDIKATFFVLGIVAREFPEMVKRISQEGHEIGTMGYYNRRLHSIPPEEYVRELEMSVSLLKSLTNKDVVTHRAPEWSITQHTLWVFDALKKYGIKYDSSIFPFNAILYGIKNAPVQPYKVNPSGIIEFPPSTFNFMGKKIALFGGTYLRTLPYTLVSMALSGINSGGSPVMIHVSPWEIEAEFPRFNLGWEGYMQQYAGLKATFPRLSQLCKDYKFDTLSNVMGESPPSDSVHINTLGGIRKENPF